MKNIYEAPKMDIVEFAVEDIIATSMMEETRGDIGDNLQPSDGFNGGGLF